MKEKKWTLKIIKIKLHVFYEKENIILHWADLLWGFWALSQGEYFLNGTHHGLQKIMNWLCQIANQNMKLWKKYIQYKALNTIRIFWENNFQTNTENIVYTAVDNMFIKCRNNNGFAYVAFFNLSALLRFNLRKINIHHQSQKKKHNTVWFQLHEYME